jgi:hypothetical protein
MAYKKTQKQNNPHSPAQFEETQKESKQTQTWQIYWNIK